MTVGVCECDPTVYDDSGHVLEVSTCPYCLPVGSIELMIENGRQLDLWEILPQVDSSISVSALTETETGESFLINMKDPSSGKGLPF